MTSQVGTLLNGRYRLDAQIGHGGMSTVYRAFDTVLERQVAIKLMHREIASYELLERVARRAGDEATVEVARRNRADEQAMAKKIANNWDRVVELALSEQGVTV